ncbi:MAG: Cobalamin import system permease protein BtuC [Methanosaeta sp. PtaU1.Bin060]|nr:MAG: Cobalamin import system permease protein BtuC [Methanosaeta sp. PtaU1.Bin060]
MDDCPLTHADVKIRTASRDVYDRITRRKLTYVVGMICAMIITFFIDIMTGPAWLSMNEVIHAILWPETSDPMVSVIVWVIRLPVALMAIAVGAALGVAGAEMQTILGNPLASPYTLGISGAAGFGAALAMVLGVGLLPYAEEFLVPLNAFIFSLISCMTIYMLARDKKNQTETIILVGIALLFLFNALVALLQYMASENQLQSVVFWLFGSLMKVTWPKLGIVAAVLILLIPMFAGDAWKLTALRLGDSKAQSLGIDVKKLRLKVFLSISLITATAVCFVGTIGFVGLVAPHISRMLVGEDQRFFMPFSALSGALLLSAASVGSKMLMPGSIFPIGIITSFIGVPFFVALILTRREGHW